MMPYALHSIADWYAKQDPERFTYHIGEKVVSLDPTAHTVTSDNGRVIAYDHCVLATGSDATLPAYADLSIPGVFVYRNISDVNRIITYAEKPEMKDCSVGTTSSITLRLPSHSSSGARTD